MIWLNYRLTCEHPGCRASLLTTGAHQTTQQLRDAARTLGWQTVGEASGVLTSGADRCPEHRVLPREGRPS